MRGARADEFQPGVITTYTHIPDLAIIHVPGEGCMTYWKILLLLLLYWV